ncbi:MAG: hypothetical protein LBK25_02550 [Treponema sp.]|nr:hypothetical protein [Treponema sp.]
MVSEAPDNAEVTLVYKRNRQVSGSGTPFRTITIVKYLNTRRVPFGQHPV